METPHRFIWRSLASMQQVDYWIHYNLPLKYDITNEVYQKRWRYLRNHKLYPKRWKYLIGEDV